MRSNFQIFQSPACKESKCMTFPIRYCCYSLWAPQCFLSRLPLGKASDTQDLKQDSTCLFWLFCALHMSSQHPPSSLFVLNHLFMLNKGPFFVRSIPGKKKKPQNKWLPRCRDSCWHTRPKLQLLSFSSSEKKRDPKRFWIRHVLCSLVTWQHKLSSCPGTGKELSSSGQVLEMLHAFITRKHHFLVFFPRADKKSCRATSKLAWAQL